MKYNFQIIFLNLEIEPSTNNTFDGLEILSSRITVKDEIEMLYSPQPKGKNIIFTKRTLLNKTSNFIPKLINNYRKKLFKQEQNLILNLKKHWFKKENLVIIFQPIHFIEE